MRGLGALPAEQMPIVAQRGGGEALLLARTCSSARRAAGIHRLSVLGGGVRDADH